MSVQRSLTRLAASRSVRGLVVVGAALAVVVGTQGVAAATPKGPGAKPPKPVIGQYDHRNAPVSSDSPDARLLQKQRAASAHYRSLVRAALRSGASPDATTSRNLSVSYQTQINEDYCGPATMAMVAGYKGVGWSGSASTQQDDAAALLGTGSDGTPWYGSDNVKSFPYSSWYPMADALDYQLYEATGNSWYNATTVSGSPTSAEGTSYKTNLTFDIDSSYPLEINQYSVPGYQFHWQPNGTWYHWLAVRGYSSTGGYSIINDPGFSAGNDASAPSTGGAGSVIQAIGGRGYIW